MLPARRLRHGNLAPADDVTRAEFPSKRADHTRRAGRVLGFEFQRGAYRYGFFNHVFVESLENLLVDDNCSVKDVLSQLVWQPPLTRWSRLHPNSQRLCRD